MEISGDYTFDGPQRIVWAALRDPDVLGTILPGGQGIKEIGENEYEGKLKIKVGPVQGTFQGNIKLENIEEPTSYDITVDGRGAPGFVKGSGSLILSAAADEQTDMVYNGTAQVGGRIASVGQRLIDASAKSIIRQSLEALNEYIKVEVARERQGDEPKSGDDTPDEQPAAVQPAAAQPAAVQPAPAAQTARPAAPPQPQRRPSPTPLPAYTPPSQTELALNVAKDVFDDVVPQQLQPVVLSVLTTLITLFIVNLFRRS